MVPSLLPPYAHLDQEAVQCIAQASSRFGVPELLVHAVIGKENGRTGKCSKNKDGTLDCGLAQINSKWNDYFQNKHSITPDQLRNNACINVTASSYILKYNYVRKGNWQDAVIAYNIGPYRWTPNRYAIGYAYAKDVVNRWWGLHAWVQANSERQ